MLQKSKQELLTAISSRGPYFMNSYGAAIWVADETSSHAAKTLVIQRSCPATTTVFSFTPLTKPEVKPHARVTAEQATKQRTGRW